MNDQPTLTDLLDRVLLAPVAPTTDPRVLRLRRQVPRAYALWTADEERCVLLLRQEGFTLDDIGVLLARQGSAVTARVQHLDPTPEPLHEHPVRLDDRLVTRLLDQMDRTATTSAVPTGLGAWVRRSRARAGQPWSPTERRLLALLLHHGYTPPDIARLLGRGLVDLQREHHALTPSHPTRSR